MKTKLHLFFCYIITVSIGFTPLSIFAQNNTIAYAAPSELILTEYKSGQNFTFKKSESNCLAGEYWDGATCQSCPIGYYCPGDDSKIICFAGTYSSTVGAAVCTNCPTGTYSLTAGANTIAACTNCPTGTYNPVAGASSSASCLFCPTGTYNSMEGASICTNCPTGTYGLSAGANTIAACTNCPTGTYNPVAGASSSVSCLFCPTGTYNSMEGASICTNCPTGTYGLSAGANTIAVCTNCPTGTYNPVAGASSSVSCLFCPMGTYNSMEGASICTNCPTGTYGLSAGANTMAVCTNCPTGTYNPVAGASSSASCLFCPTGTYNSMEGAGICTNCPAGYTTSATGTTSVAACTVVLPLEMMDFKVWTTANNVVQIRWSTLSEKNVSFYIVQKSTDGSEWTTIARMNGKGNSSTRTDYATADPFPTKGIIYYRIKEFDFDGTNHYSPTVAVEITLKSQLKIYPNPTGNELNVALADEKITSVQVLNLLGQLQIAFTFSPTHIGMMNLQNLQAGQYILKVHTEGGLFTDRITKY